MIGSRYLQVVVSIAALSSRSRPYALLASFSLPDNVTPLTCCREERLILQALASCHRWACGATTRERGGEDTDAQTLSARYQHTFVKGEQSPITGLSLLTGGRIVGEANVSINAEYDVLDRKLGDRVINNFNELLGELFYKGMPILLRLTELGVMY